MSDREANVILTASNSEYNKSIEESTKATDKFQKALDKTATSASNINKATAKGLLKIGAGELAGLTALSAVAANLEKQTSNIQANLSLNKTSSQYNAVTSSIREMSRTIPVARAEIAAMATEVSNLGFVSGSQISKVTQQFSKMGIATGESPTALAQNMVQFQRAMGVAPSDQTMSPYSNSTTLLSARAGVPANDILSFAGNIAPAARVAGLNQSTVLGLSTAATRAGADGTYASSTISQILNDITMLRYSKSPEIKRYSSALGIPLEQLTGKVENTDTFNRDIITKILSASQSEEGPSRLGLLGFDGLRAKKALQMMASEPGGVEQWINTAQAGMGSKSIETGFEAASGGLADQMIMLRNQMTDLGQVVGTPTMNAFTGVTTVANKAAEGLQFLVEPMAKLAGIFTGPLAAMTMGAGAVLGAWKAFSTYSFMKRGINNVGTSAFGSGFMSGQGVANGADPNMPINAMSANVMSGDPRRASAFQRTAFGIGSGLGTMMPNAEIGKLQGPLQKSLEGINRFTNWMSTGTSEWYRRTGMTPTERYADKINTQEAVQKYKADDAERERRIAKLQAVNPSWTREAVLADKGGRAFVGEEPVRPAGMFKPQDRYTVSGTALNVLKAGPQAAWDATKMAVHEPGKALGAIRQAGSAGIADFRSGAGASIAGGIGSAVSGLLSPQMLMLYGGMAAYKAYDSGDKYASRWEEGGKGFDGEITNGMTLYNQKLGIATTSLERFAAAVDEANPAKTDDNAAELNDKVYQRGSAADYKMQDERIKMFVRSPESAEKYIASQGNLNTDQLVTIFADLGKVLSKADWNKVRESTLANRNESGNLTTGAVTTDYKALSDSMIHGIQDSMNIFQKIGANVSSVFTSGGFDPLGLTGSQKVGQIATDYIGTAMSTGAYIGDTKDASKIVTSGSDTEKSATLTRAVQFGKAAEALSQLNDTYQKNFKSNSLGTETAASRAAFMAAKDRIGEYLKVDLKGVDPGENGGKEVWDKIYSEIKTQSGEDPQLKAMLDSGLITKNQQFDGKSLNQFISDLEEKKVTTSVDTMIGSSKFKGMSDKEKETWFGPTSVLKDLGTGIGDPVKQVAASFKMLQLAQSKFGESITSTDAALQSFKNGLNSSDPSYAIIEGAQQLNQIKEGQFFDAGASPTDKTAARKERTNAAIDAAKAESNPDDAQQKLTSVLQENTDVIINNYTKLHTARKQYDRQNFDFDQQVKWQKKDFNLSQEYAEDDYQRSLARSKASYHRQFINSEASFYRSLKYQSQDFYRSREREEAAHQRQMRYSAEDQAKSVADPYNRLGAQLVGDPAALIANQQNRLAVVENQNKAIDKLKGMGLSDPAIQQLGLTKWENAQQAIHIANKATQSEIGGFNQVAEKTVTESGKLNQSDPDTIRAEKERNISLTQGLEDFLRGLKRTKVEHEIQVKFSQKEFRIGLADSAKEHSISMDRAEESFNRAQERSKTVFEQSIGRQREDLLDYFETYAKTQEEMVKQASKDSKALGIDANNVITEEIKSASDNLKALWKTIGDLGDINISVKITSPSNPISSPKITSPSDPRDAGKKKPKGTPTTAGQSSGSDYLYLPDKDSGKGSGSSSVSRALADNTNDPRKCLSQVSEWIGNAPHGIPNAITAWNIAKDKHKGDEHPPAGRPVFWSGGDGHVALSLGGGNVRSTDWPSLGSVGTVSIEHLTSAWNKPYLGWTGDAWGKMLADGGILPAKAGGHKITAAEGGSAEMVLPLNSRGIDFMSTFTKGVAREMTKSLPRTPVSAASTITYDHSSSMRIDNVNVESQDPKKFMKELAMEASKKRAALYKS